MDVDSDDDDTDQIPVRRDDSSALPAGDAVPLQQIAQYKPPSASASSKKAKRETGPLVSSTSCATRAAKSSRKDTSPQPAAPAASKPDLAQKIGWDMVTSLEELSDAELSRREQKILPLVPSFAKTMRCYEENELYYFSAPVGLSPAIMRELAACCNVQESMDDSQLATWFQSQDAEMLLNDISTLALNALCHYGIKLTQKDQRPRCVKRIEEAAAPKPTKPTVEHVSTPAASVPERDIDVRSQKSKTSVTSERSRGERSTCQNAIAGSDDIAEL